MRWAHQDNLGANLMRHLVVAMLVALLLSSFAAGATPDHTSAYVTDAATNSTKHLSVQSNNQPVSIPVGTLPFGVAILPDGSKVYVSNNNLSMTGTVSRIRTADDSVMPIAVGRMPAGIAANGSRVFVANFLSHTLSVIDTATDAVIRTVTGIGIFPRGVAVSPTTSFVYVSSFSSDAVTVVDASTLSVVVPATFVGFDPFGIAVAPDGTAVYVALEGESALGIYDPASLALLAKIGTGSRPTGVAVSPDGKWVYVTNSGSNSVTVVDAAARAALKTISVGSAPVGVSVSGDGHRAYVANSLGESLSVISTATHSVVGTISLLGSKPVAFGQFMLRGTSVMRVQIDIRPSSINRKATGKVPVVLFGSEDFHVAMVNLETVRLGGAPVAVRGNGYMAEFGDWNNDGLLDLLLHVENQAIQASAVRTMDNGDSGLALEGQTNDHPPINFEGTDAVRMVPP